MVTRPRKGGPDLSIERFATGLHARLTAAMKGQWGEESDAASVGLPHPTIGVDRSKLNHNSP
jgi:hypothetical protein